MAKLVWKKLKEHDVEKFLDHLDSMQEDERPLYGLVGQQRNAFLSILIEINKPHALIFTRNSIVLSHRSARGAKEKNRRDYAIDDLVSAEVIRGPLLESLALEFKDGFKIKLRDVQKDQGDQVENFIREGIEAFHRDRLTPVQLTTCYFAYNFAGLIPTDLLK